MIIGSAPQSYASIVVNPSMQVEKCKNTLLEGHGENFKFHDASQILLHYGFCFQPEMFADARIINYMCE
jgi:hypothetical protein